MSRKRKSEEYDIDYEPFDIAEIIKNLDNESMNNFRMVRNEIERTDPDIKKILKDSLTLEDRTKLFQMYEIYADLIPNTDTWLDYREKFNKVYQECKDRYVQYVKVNKKDHDRMDKEESKYKSYDSHLSFRQKILSLDASPEVKKVIYRRYQEFVHMKPSDDEYIKTKSWILWAINMPYNKVKKFSYNSNKLTKFLRDASVKMDAELYGMKKIKEQILVFLNAKLLNPSMKGCSLGLLGPPGTGKSAISRLLADIMQYPFDQISFGGVTNAEYLKGHDFTYVGSQPGEIAKCLRRMQYKNGIMYFDEYEKAANHPDVKAALLHITDYNQNDDYRDSYLSEIPLDLSHLWFIYSMNELPKDPALKDRIFYIKLPGYTEDEKVQITRDYLLPKALINAGLPQNSIKFDNNRTVKYLLELAKGIDVPGVRIIEKNIVNIVIKLVFIVNHQSTNGVLEGFVVSFDPKQQLSYPITLTPKLLKTMYEK
jgi:ATP-dependent Lon protease